MSLSNHSATSIAKIILPAVVLTCSVYLAVKISSNGELATPAPTVNESFAQDAGVTTLADAGSPFAADAGIDSQTNVRFASDVSDAGPVKIRPTAEQLDKEYLSWELEDLEKQATNPEDKALIHRAFEIKMKRIRDLRISNDFEKNMNRAIK